MTLPKKTLSKKADRRSFIKKMIYSTTAALSANVLLKNSSLAKGRSIRCLVAAGAIISQKSAEVFAQKTGIEVKVVRSAQFDKKSLIKELEHYKPDVIIANNIIIGWLRFSKHLLMLDKSKIPNSSNVFKIFLNHFDADSKYAIPYSWGTIGIGYNPVNFAGEKINSWRYLYDSQKYKKRIFLLDHARYLFGIGLKLLGYSANDSSMKHLKQVEEMLKHQSDNISGFHHLRGDIILQNDQSKIVQCLSSHLKKTSKNNDIAKYVIPKEGTIIWQNSVAVFNQSENINEAHLFLNYLFDTEVGMREIMINNYGTTNQMVYEALPAELKQDSVIFPDFAKLAKSELLVDLGIKYDQAIASMLKSLKQLI